MKLARCREVVKTSGGAKKLVAKTVFVEDSVEIGAEDVRIDTHTAISARIGSSPFGGENCEVRGL
jgi:hypothetical protein